MMYFLRACRLFDRPLFVVRLCSDDDVMDSSILGYSAFQRCCNAGPVKFKREKRPSHTGERQTVRTQ